MQVSGSKNDGLFVVRVNGRLDAITAPAFEQSCLDWIHQGESTLVMDLEGLDYISSAGLRSILVIGKKLKMIGGSISFSSLKPDVAHVFSVSGFASMFPVHESIDRAIGKA